MRSHLASRMFYEYTSRISKFTIDQYCELEKVRVAILGNPPQDRYYNNERFFKPASLFDLSTDHDG